MKYTYTAVITYDERSHRYHCRVPDLNGCISSGRDLSEALDMIQDAAAVWLVSSEDHGDPFIPPTPQSKVAHQPDDYLSIIRIDTIKYRAETDTRAVRKSVSIPAWMANLAGRYGMNLSQLLQDALRAAFEAHNGHHI